jgi:predicted permease
MDALLHDIRSALRTTRRHPGFAAAVVLTVALGIAVLGAAFGAVHAVLLRPLPVRDQGRLVVIRAEDRSRSSDPHLGVPNGVLWDASARSRTVTELAGVPPLIGASPFAVHDGDRTIQLAVTPVTSNLFHVLGVTPALGRTLEPADDRSSGPVVVMSYRAWRRDFDARADIVGRVLQLPMGTFTVVGITPEGFDYPKGTDIWLSDAQLDYLVGFTPRADQGYWDLVGRLGPRATIEQARSELTALLQDYESPFLGDPASRLATIQPYVDVITGDLKPALLILWAAGALVLLIACANVSSLLLARELVRESELAIRSALGAGRARLLRLLTIESLVLGLVGGASGALLAALLLRAAVVLAPPGLARFDELQLRPAVLAFVLALTVGVAIVCGLISAPRTTHGGLERTLRAGSRALGDARGGRARRWLVVAQVALAAVVLVGAGLAVRSLARLQRVDLGFEREHLLYAVVERLDPGSTMPSDIQAARARYRTVMAELAERLRHVPGIVGAAPTDMIPFRVVGGTYGLDDHYNVEGQALREGLKSPLVGFDVASEDYFRIMGIPLFHGRAFTSEDHVSAPRVAIVSEAMARQAWPGQNPVGQRLRLVNDRGYGAWRTVVGVVGDTRSRDLGTIRPTVYIPLAQADPGPVLAIRTTGNPLQVRPIVEHTLRELDSGYRIGKAISIGQVLDVALAQPRFLAAVLATLSLTAVLLAAVGLYGVLALLVRQRTHEIGVRLALGAAPAAVRALVVRQSILLAGTGISAGLLVSLASTRVLRALLFEISPTDPLTLVGVMALLLTVALLAAWVPAMRASRVDPMIALRAE